VLRYVFILSARPWVFSRIAFQAMSGSRATFFKFLVVACLLGAASIPLAAWDAEGHELVATMAYGQLNPKARKAVDALAKELQNPAQSYDAISMACWMDDLRARDSTMPYHGLFLSWHYIDLGIESGDPAPSLEPGDDNEMHGNVVQALKRALVVLKGGTDPYVKNQAIACAMIMHLVGDIHQPLHAATKYFQSHGALHQDAGGNKEEVTNGPPGNPHFSLHNFWDSAWRASFDEASGRVVLDERYTEDGGPDLPRIQALAEILVKQAPLAGTDLEPHFDQWARESNDLARSFVYRQLMATDSPKYCRLSSGYVAKANSMARERLVLAAYRLATLLNETLGAEGTVVVPPSYPAGPVYNGQGF
jgi:hypothetical protein